MLATQGFNIKTTKHAHVELTMWDIGGQKAIRPFWKDYFEQADALVYVIDSADRNRLEESVNELQCLLKDDKMAGVPLLVFANKQVRGVGDVGVARALSCFSSETGLFVQDLTLAASPADISDTLMLHKLRDRQWQIQPCSAKSGEGLSEGVDWCVGWYKS